MQERMYRFKLKYFNKKYKIKALILLITLIFFPFVFNSLLLPFPSKMQDKSDLTDYLNVFPSSNDPPNTHYFTFYKIITIDKDKVSGTSSHSNFPLLISILDTDLRYDVQPDGDDIAFSANGEWLDHEIELFDQTYSSTHAQLIAWVRIPSLSTSINTNITMYYGNATMGARSNPTGVWLYGYVGVWHMNQDPSGPSPQIKDSTGNNNDGSTLGTMTSNDLVMGKIGYGIEFDGIDDAININNDATLNPVNYISMEAWSIADSVSETHGIVTKTFNQYQWMLRLQSPDGHIRISIEDALNTYNAPSSLSTGIYHHIAGTYDGSNIRAYLDGTEDGSGYSLSTTMTDNNGNVRIGSKDATLFWDGIIDEVRISDVPRSASWIKTEIDNQNNPSSFYTITEEKLVNEKPPKINYFNFYKIITIDHTKVPGSGSYVNFPLLISIQDEDLRFDVQPDGDDIAFSANGKWLDHEIELFNQTHNNTHARLIAWVRVPFLSTSEDTNITMYYSNSTMGSRQNSAGVWINNFNGVWHLNELTGGVNAIKDSTGYSNDGTDSNNPTFGEKGQIYNSIEFTYNSGERIEVSDDASLHISNQVTIQAWIRPSTFSGQWRTILSKMDGDWGNGQVYNYDLYFAISPTNYHFIGLSNPSDAFDEWQTSFQAPTEAWQHYVFTYQASTSMGSVFINGAFMGQHNFGLGPLDTNSNPFYIGFNLGWLNEVFDGHIDEVRIVNSIRSAGWINTEYVNQNDPKSFYSIGSEKLISIEPPNTDYFNYYKNITIDHTKVSGTGSHLNFPLLISIQDKDLRFDVQPDGDDIAFSANGKWLDHQIELFNQIYSSTHAQLIAWVRVPFLSTAEDTNITMYYSNSTMSSQQNPEDVWDENYMGIWHLNEDPSGNPPQIKDSTMPYSNGSTYGVMTSSDQVTGKIDGALDFDGANDYINMGNLPELRITGELTVQIWFKADIIGNDYLFNKMGGSSTTYGWDISFDQDTGSNGWVTFRYYDGISVKEVGYERISTGNWYHAVGVFKPSDYAKFFLNGTLVDSLTSGIAPSLFDPPISVVLGRRSQGTTPYYDGILDEARISNISRSDDWIYTEYNNQFDPNSFYSVGEEKLSKSLVLLDAKVYAYDLYGNVIPNANITMYKDDELINDGITSSDGSVLFTNILSSSYNFTVVLNSYDGTISEIVNITSKAILIDKIFQKIDLICNVSTNFFKLIDVDDRPVESGWILVGNSTKIFQNCTINNLGLSIFWWVNITPYEYNYTVKYKNSNYIPNTIKLASGNLTKPNQTNIIIVNLTTVNFTLTSESGEPVSGAKLHLRVNSTSGDSIVNLTTNQNGKTTMRWLNSSGIQGNYSLQIEFFGDNILFYDSILGLPSRKELNFTVSSEVSFDLKIVLDLKEYATELISLNPTDNIVLEWGTQLKLRVLFNITKAGTNLNLIGPRDADSSLYEIYQGTTLISLNSMYNEEDETGILYSNIDTHNLESDTFYLIIISAQISGFSIPSDLILQLQILKNNLELNQSENNDVVQEIYWSEDLNMTVKPYGKVSEDFTVQDYIFHDINHSFQFSIPNISTDWNLSRIIFNFFNITWNTINPLDINITILDPYSNFWIFNTSNHMGWDFNLGEWIGITLTLNQASPSSNNTFDFIIGGSFGGTVDIIADAYFIRDKINIQYSKFNISNSISILSQAEGWAIRNITFQIQNCYEISTWSKGDLSTLTNINITTNNGFKYMLNSGDGNGNGILTIDDIIINPYGNQFLFTVESYTNIIFDVIIKVEYIQEFYINQYLETLNLSLIVNDINNGGTFHLNSIENDWNDNLATLWINGINDGISFYYPSELAMNITIDGKDYNILDFSRGYGRLSLDDFDKGTLYLANITTNFPVNFTISFIISYSRTVNHDIKGLVSYIIREAPSILGSVQYDSNLRAYLQTIDTSILDANEYTIRFTIDKEHYISAIKDLEFIVLNRPTLINGYPDFYRKLTEIYIGDAVNFTFYYVDALTGSRIIELKTQNFIWEQYSSDGNITATGQADISEGANNLYILDFNTENKTLGDYLIIATFDKKNYDYKNGMIFLTIKKREINYMLSNNFKNQQINVIKGQVIYIELNLTDPTREDIPLLNATVSLTISNISYYFYTTGNGTYILEFPTANINTFFASKTLRGVINISKVNYISEEFSIIIVVKMEEVFPGMPTFYFLLIISIIIAFVGSIVGYKIYKYTQIPIFIKKVRSMKKAIDGEKTISESLLYRDKEVFIGEIIKDKWEKVGLSLEEILGIEIEKEKKQYKLKRKISEKTRRHDQKPRGLLMMKWDERIGTEIIVKYPYDIGVSEKTLMQIYSTHEYTGEKGVVNLMAESLNILSYYTGPDTGYYLLLFLNLDDDPDVYEGGMPDILRAILENLKDDSYLQMIQLLFQRLSVYPTLSDEEILALHYQNEIKRIIINLLREDGVITKSELMILLKDKQLEGFFDLDAVLNDLIKMDIIKVSSIKGLPSELVYLINDIFMLRIPPIKLLEDPVSHGLPSQFLKEYTNDVKKFFQEYHPTEEDNIKITEIITNPQVYETLRLLRTAIVTRKDLEKLKKKGVEDFNEVLKLLWDNKMIKVYHDEKKNEYYALLSDFYIDFIFPKYVLKTVKTAYELKSKLNKVLIEYLNVLEEAFTALKSSEKQ